MNMIVLMLQAIWNKCYITYDMDFRFVPRDHVCFDKLQFVITKPGMIVHHGSQVE